MSVIALTPQNFDLSSIEVHPSRSFSSGSHHVSGTVNVYARRSSAEKDAQLTYTDIDIDKKFGSPQFVNLLEALEAINTSPTFPEVSYEDHVELYMKKVRELGQSERKRQDSSIRHFRPTPTHTTASFAKNFFRKTLYRNYKTRYHNLNWAYTNFNCLNFFTGSFNYAHGHHDPDAAGNAHLTGTALIYPAPTASYRGSAIYQKLFIERNFPYKLYNMYRPRRGFTFEFWINPRYNDLDKQGEFPAGTIMHMSSCYAVSLVTGSKKDLKGNPADFKIVLQMSHSADVAPRDVITTMLNNDNVTIPVPNNLDTAGSVTNPRRYPYNLIFMSSASLYHNHWHHVAIRWDQSQQQRRGMFVVDGVPDLDGQFLIDSSSHGFVKFGEVQDTGACCPQWFPSALSSDSPSEDLASRGGSDPDALFIGNYYEGPNKSVDGSEIARFFNGTTAKAMGVHALRPDISDSPKNFKFRHDLQAEVHELRLWNHGLDLDLIKSRMGTSLNLAMVQKFAHEPIKMAAHGALFDPFSNRYVYNPYYGYIVKDYSYFKDGVKWSSSPDDAAIDKQKLLFYLPVLFTKESPVREVLWTPFYKTGPSVPIKGQGLTSEHDLESTVTPFNAKLAFSSNCLQINLPNFLREHALRQYPLLYNLSASVDQTKLMSGDANQPPIVTGDGFGTQLNGWANFTPKTSLLGGGAESTAAAAAQKERIAKANSLILPCDNGLFRPYFPLLASGSFENSLQGDTSLDIVKFDKGNAFLDYKSDHFLPPSGSILSKFVDDEGVLDFSMITLNDLIFQAKNYSIMNLPELSVTQLFTLAILVGGPPVGISGVTGTSPFLPYLFPIGMLQDDVYTHYSPPNEDGKVTILTSKSVGSLGARTYMGIALRENSSNMVSFFDIPQLYYGDRILPGSMTIRGILGLVKSETDQPFKAPLKITLKDNGAGSLYRADCKTPHATWNNVGDILYEEGFVIIKSPHLYTFGLNSAQLSELPGVDDKIYGYSVQVGDQQVAKGEAYSLDFQGERYIHVLEIMVPAPAGMFNSSSNPTYENLHPTDFAADANVDFNYITGLNFHDDNFNVIARTNLAQPVVKRHEDKLFFRVKIDF